MKKLIPMTEFVIQEWKKDIYTDDFARIVYNYANFLKEPLKLEMFVPCDEDGKFLQEPELIYKEYNPYEEAQPEYDLSECENYKKALEKVLFKDFVYKRNIYEITKDKLSVSFQNGCINIHVQISEFRGSYTFGDTIEDFTKYGLELTENAKKQLKLDL